MRCISNYIKLTVSLIAIILTIFVFSGINLASESLQNIAVKTQEKIFEEKLIKQEKNNDEEIEQILEKNKYTIQEEWQVEIPTIGVKAQIAEGTSQEVMREYIGHFENTNIWKGNIGLAAHNRGFPINYFEKVKDLKLGDEIIYKTSEGTRIYEVETYTIIEETDWSYLQETEENRITLITCVSNQPTKRLCVQAIEKG